ncbi:FYVE zinc finger [Aphelenchoides fujianensis]|nr:FYVE zinc finger [Aphelenchoides fujianensis]
MSATINQRPASSAFDSMAKPVEYFPNVPTSLFVQEETLSVFVGLVTGWVLQCTISEDMNKIEIVRRRQAHTHAVSGIVLSPNGKEVFTCGKDKHLVWASTETGLKTGNYVIDSPCTTMQFDAATNFAFVGDVAGSIFVLRIAGTTAQLVSKLSAHSSAICDLAWDSNRQHLFSGGADSLVILWDIGARQGQCYELNSLPFVVISVVTTRASRRWPSRPTTRNSFSADANGKVVCWDLKAKRTVAPAWKEADKCELCDTPFLFLSNLRTMWNRQRLGAARHHCRTCGRSVCAQCSGHTTVFPAMGFERPTRICNTCHQKMESYPEQFDLTPLAAQCDLRHGITSIQLDEKGGRLATVGDRAINVFNVRAML